MRKGPLRSLFSSDTLCCFGPEGRTDRSPGCRAAADNRVCMLRGYAEEDLIIAGLERLEGALWSSRKPPHRREGLPWETRPHLSGCDEQ